MAGDVNHLRRTNLSQQFEHLTRATFPRRIKQNCGRWRGESPKQSGEQVFGRACNKFAVRDTVGRSILTRRLNRQPIQFNANERFHQPGQFNAEKPNAAIHIHQVFGPRTTQTLSGDFDKFWQQKEIVLEKGIARDFPAVGRDSQNDFETTFGRRILAHVFDLFVQSRFGNGAFLNIHDQPVVGSDKANIQALFELVPLAANHDAIAIAVRLGAGDKGFDDVWVDPADPLEEIADLFVFELQLRRVGDVLILAPAAIAEVAARGSNAVRRRLNDPPKPRATESLFCLSNFGFDHFGDLNERDEDYKIFDSRNAFTTERNVGNGEGQVFANSGTHASRLRKVRSGRKVIVIGNQ